MAPRTKNSSSQVRRKTRPVDLTKLKRYDAARRRSLVKTVSFAKPPDRKDRIELFLNKLPDILKATDFNALLDAIVHARKIGKPIVWMLGAHVLKCGLSPIVIDLMKKGLVDLLAFNGAGAIHDLEIAFLGRTSEDVVEGLEDGRFGMARDTARWFAGGVAMSKDQGIGLGEGMGRYIGGEHPSWKKHSLLWNCVQLGIPALVFPAIGAEIVAQHPEFDAAACGAGGHLDFRILADQCRSLNRGGVVLQFGSAVILPEVFLKALSVARNLQRVGHFTTASFDMIQHYRSLTNVVIRPTLESGKGYQFTGHHEIMLPLLAWSLVARLKL